MALGSLMDKAPDTISRAMTGILRLVSLTMVTEAGRTPTWTIASSKQSALLGLLLGARTTVITFYQVECYE